MGEQAEGIQVFRVPFAQPPLGDLRWRPPLPAEPWEDVKSAERFGPACYQALAKTPLYGVETLERSEDAFT